MWRVERGGRTGGAGGYPPPGPVRRVVVDDVQGGYRAVQHLIELGHERIAFVGDPIHTAFNFTSSRDRLVGLQQALAEHGIPFRRAYHRAGEHGQEPARAS